MADACDEVEQVAGTEDHDTLLLPNIEAGLGMEDWMATSPSFGSGIRPKSAIACKNLMDHSDLRNSITPEFIPERTIEAD